jgi:hypothetical protein
MKREIVCCTACHLIQCPPLPLFSLLYGCLQNVEHDAGRRSVYAQIELRHTYRIASAYACPASAVSTLAS